MIKKIIVCSLLFLAVSVLAFASGGSEGRLYYLPMNVANNSNVMIELSEAKSATKSLIESLGEQDNADENHLVVFRLRDNILKPYNSNKEYINLTISSNDNWELVHEENPTKRIHFTLSVYCKEKQYASDGNYSAFETSNALSQNSTLPKSGKTSSLTDNGTVYQLSMPTTDYNQSETILSIIHLNQLPIYVRDYYFCINIPEHEVIEPGYYSTTITLSSESYYEVSLQEASFLGITYYKLVQDSETTNIQKTISTITIRGYIGKEPGSAQGSYSFMVSNATDTLSMDLGISNANTPYNIAKISFYHTKIVTSTDSAAGNKDNFTAYKIYISPESNYNISGQYRFRLVGSEGYTESNENTIYYDLYISPKDDGSLTKLDSCANPTTQTSYNNYQTNTQSNYGKTLGGVKKVSNTSSYILYPYYNYVLLSSSEKTYQMTWKTEKYLYIKLTSASTNAYNQHGYGMYTSRLYFTVESP